MQDTEETNIEENSNSQNDEKVTEIDFAELGNMMKQSLNHKIQIKISLTTLIIVVGLALAFFYFGILAILKISA